MTNKAKKLTTRLLLLALCAVLTAGLLFGVGPFEGVTPQAEAAGNTNYIYSRVTSTSELTSGTYMILVATNSGRTTYKPLSISAAEAQGTSGYAMALGSRTFSSPGMSISQTNSDFNWYVNVDSDRGFVTIRNQESTSGAYYLKMYKEDGNDGAIRYQTGQQTVTGSYAHAWYYEYSSSYGFALKCNLKKSASASDDFRYAGYSSGYSGIIGSTYSSFVTNSYNNFQFYKLTRTSYDIEKSTNDSNYGTVGTYDTSGNAITSAAAGTTVKVYATPASGYYCFSLFVNKYGTTTQIATPTLSSDGTYWTFTMPSEPVTVKGNFLSGGYEITRASTGGYGRVALNWSNGTSLHGGGGLGAGSGSGSLVAPQNAQINITTAPAVAGVALKSLKVYKTGDTSTVVSVTTDTVGSAYHFTMPGYPVTVEAVYDYTYEIERLITTNGTVEISAPNAVMATGSTSATLNVAHNALVTVKTTPNSGYELKSLEIKWTTASNNTYTLTPTVVTAGREYTFNMPDGKVTVGAYYATKYSITTVATSHGAIGFSAINTTKSPSAASQTGNVATGAAVTVNLQPDSGYAMRSIRITYTVGSTTYTISPTVVTRGKIYSFTMPSGNVTIEAVFDAEYSIFRYAATNGTLEINSPSDKLLASSSSGTMKAAAGSPITMTATPQDGYMLKSLEITDITNNVTITPTCGFSNAYSTFSFTMPSGNVHVRPIFAEAHTITRSATTHGNVSITGPLGAWMATGNTEKTMRAAQGQSITVSWYPDSGYVLQSLTFTYTSSNTVTVIEPDEIDNNSYTFTMGNRDVIVTATFAQGYQLTRVATVNGKVQLCGGYEQTDLGNTNTSIQVPAGETVTVNTMPDTGYALQSLSITQTNSGDNVRYTVVNPGREFTFIMPAGGEVQVRATYGAAYTITRSAITANTGTVEISSINGTLSAGYTEDSVQAAVGALVTVSVQPGSNYRTRTFMVTRTSDGSIYTPNIVTPGSRYTFTANVAADRTVTASFGIARYVTLSSSDYGTYSATDPIYGTTINEGESMLVAQGAQLPLTAAVDAQYPYYEFTGWTRTGAGTFEDASVENTAFTVGTMNATLTANFTEKATAITLDENGNVTVPSAESGNYVGGSYTLPDATVAYIPNGFTFEGWVTEAIPYTEQTRPATVYSAGDTIAPTQGTTYYALYYGDDDDFGKSFYTTHVRFHVTYTVVNSIESALTMDDVMPGSTITLPSYTDMENLGKATLQSWNLETDAYDDYVFVGWKHTGGGLSGPTQITESNQNNYDIRLAGAEYTADEGNTSFVAVYTRLSDSRFLLSANGRYLSGSSWGAFLSSDSTAAVMELDEDNKLYNNGDTYDPVNFQLSAGTLMACYYYGSGSGTGTSGTAASAIAWTTPVSNARYLCLQNGNYYLQLKANNEFGMDTTAKVLNRTYIPNVCITEPLYPVFFDGNAGTDTVTNLPETMVATGGYMISRAELASLSVPVRSGYRFVAWSKSPDWYDEHEPIWANADGETTIYAHWVPEYHIYFIINGEPAPGLTIAAIEGETVTLPNWAAAEAEGFSEPLAYDWNGTWESPIYGGPYTYSIIFDCWAVCDPVYAAIEYEPDGWIYGSDYTMGDSDVTMRAVWEFNEGWSGNDKWDTITDLDYSVSASVTGSGSLSFAPGDGQHLYKDNEVTVTVSPADGWELISIAATNDDDGSSVPVTPVAGTDDQFTFSMPAEDVTVTAEFGLINWTVSLDSPANGTISAENPTIAEGGSATATEGTVINLTAVPDDGYVFAGWTNSTGIGSFEDASASSTTFTVGRGDATISASFAAIRSITYVVRGETVTIPGAPTQVVEGQSVTLPDAAALSGAGLSDTLSYYDNVSDSFETYTFCGWTTVSTAITTPKLASALPSFTTITGGSGDVTVYAVYSGTCYRFGRFYSSDSIATGDYYVRNPASPYYLMTAKLSGGQLTGTADSAGSLTAVGTGAPELVWHITQRLENGTTFYTFRNAASGEYLTLAADGTLSMQSTVSDEAMFHVAARALHRFEFVSATHASYYLWYDTNSHSFRASTTEPTSNMNRLGLFSPGSTGYLTDVLSYSVSTVSVGGGTVLAAPNSAVQKDQTVTVTLEIDNYYELTSLTAVRDDDGTTVDLTPVAGTDDQYTFTMPASDVTVTGEFHLVLWTVSLGSPENGTIAATVPTIAEGGSVTVTQDTEISLIAIPDEGYVFTGWTNSTGIGSFEDANAAVTSFAVGYGDAVISANFTAVRSISYVVRGEAVTIPGAPTQVLEGETVTLPDGAALASTGLSNALSYYDSGCEGFETYTFCGWTTVSTQYTAPTPDGLPASGTVTGGSGDLTLYAVYGGTCYQFGDANGSAGYLSNVLSFNVSAHSTGNGWVSASPNRNVQKDQPVTVTVGPYGDYELASLTAVRDDDGTTVELTPVAGEPNQFTFSMPASNVTVTASFRLVSWTVSLGSPEGGTISAADPTIAEGGSASVMQESVISLTAVPDEGYVFSGWTNSTGIGSFDDASASSTTFTVGAGDAAISAIFTANRGITYVVRGEAVTIPGAPTQVLEGETVTLPDGAALTSAGLPTTLSYYDKGSGSFETYTFCGWTTVSTQFTTPTRDGLPAVSSVTGGSSSVTLYAVYSGTCYQFGDAYASASLTTGNYYVRSAVAPYYMMTAELSGGQLLGAADLIGSAATAGSGAADMVWRIAQTTESGATVYTFRDVTTGNYLTLADNGTLSLEDEATEEAMFTLAPGAANRFAFCNVEYPAYWLWYDTASHSFRANNAEPTAEENQLSLYTIGSTGFLSNVLSYSVSAVTAGGGTVSASPNSAAQKDQPVTVTVNPDSGYALSTLTAVRDDDGTAVDLTPVSGADNQFTFAMPAANVTVTAVFEDTTVQVDDLLVCDKYAFSVEGVLKAQFAIFDWLHPTRDYESYYITILHYMSDGTEDPSGERTMNVYELAPGYIARVAFYDVYATYMADRLDVTVYAVKDGVTYHGPTLTMSIRSIATDTLTDPSNSAAKKRTYADMLAYGAEAQLRFGYNVDDLANALTGEALDNYNTYITTEEPVFVTLDSIVSTPDNMGQEKVTLWRRALSTEERVYMQFGLYFGDYDVSDFTVRVTIGDRVETVTDENLVLLDPSYPGYYVLKVMTIDAVEGQTPVSVTVYEGDTPVSRTYIDTIENMASTKTGEDAPLASRLVRFYRSVYNLIYPY